MLDFAQKIARGAGRIIVRDFGGKRLKVHNKSTFEPVSKTDEAVEAHLFHSIQRKFPNHNILSEEFGFLNQDSEYTWVLDPLDGTVNFIHAYPYVCISIGLLKKDKPFLGVVFNPLNGELFFAQRDEGAFLNGKKIKVSGVKKIEKAHVATGFSYKRGKEFKGAIKKFARVLSVTQAVRRNGSGALDVCNIACGRYDGFWIYGGKIWDYVGALCVLKEAGGIFKCSGKENYSLDLIAGNRPIFNQLCKIL